MFAPTAHRNPIADEIKPLREDIKAAITIIGRREDWPKGKERLKKEREKKYNLDLRDCDLQGAWLVRANLSRARLDNTNFRGAQLDRSNLRGARIFGANFSNVRFVWANLHNVWLSNANLTKAVISRADLTRAILYNVELVDAILYKTDMTNAQITNTNMSYANITETNMENTRLRRVSAYKINFSICLNLIPKQLENTFCGTSVAIPDDWEAPKHWPEEKMSYNNFKEASEQWRIRGKWDNLQLSLAFDNPKD